MEDNLKIWKKVFALIKIVTGNVEVTEKGSLQEQIEQLEQGNNIVEFLDYTGDGTELPDPEEAVSQVSSGKTDKVFRQYVKASLKGLLNLAQKALNIALGKNQARVFATVAALDAWLAVPANVQQLNVGDNFYITAVDVPDYWWDGNQKQKLETQKVDLTTYDQRITANASSIGDLQGKAVLKTDIINNTTSTSENKPLSANQGKVLKDQIDELNGNITALQTGMLKYRTGWKSGLTIPSSQNTVIEVTFNPFPNDIIIVIPIVRGGIQFHTWINTMENGKVEIIAINSRSGELTDRSIQWIAIGY